MFVIDKNFKIFLFFSLHNFIKIAQGMENNIKIISIFNKPNNNVTIVLLFFYKSNKILKIYKNINVKINF